MANPFQEFDDTLEERLKKAVADSGKLSQLSFRRYFHKKTPHLPNPFYFLEHSLKNYFSQSAILLVDYAMVSCQKKPENLPLPFRLELYARFLREFVTLFKLNYLPRMVTQIPALEDLLNEVSYSSFSAHLIQSEAHLNLLKDVLQSLQKKKYLTRRASSLLFDLISPYHSPEKFDSPPPSKKIENATFPPAPTTFPSIPTNFSPTLETLPLPLPPLPAAGEPAVEDTPAENISRKSLLSREYLLSLGLDEDTAEKYSSLMLPDLQQVFSCLEARLGREPAQCLLRSNPDIFAYPSKNQFNKYLKSLNALSEKSSLASYLLEEYSSLEKALALKSRLFPNGQNLDNHLKENLEPSPSESRKISLDKKSLAKYTFLHNNNLYVTERLNDLLTTGKTAVTDLEHWGGETSGARGARILKKIRHQMKCLYAELGFPEPRCQINFSQQTLEISPSDRRILSEIVESINNYQS